MDLNRRNFLKMVGVTTAASALPGCEPGMRRLIPYVWPDEEIVPGVANWYASTCRECSAGCGIIVRVMEGRAKKIEGNPDHPVNRGKLCARGQAALQRLYNPDRVRGPLRRTERYPIGTPVPISWGSGIRLLADQLREARGRVIMISRPLTGTLAALLSSFMHSIGGQLFFYEPGAELSLRTATLRSDGIEAWPYYDMARTDYLLSFGAPFLEHWLSPVASGIAYGHMRQGRRTTRGRVVQIEPRLSLTAANADRWIPIRPGMEGLLAMGIGQVLLMEGTGQLSGARRHAYEQFYTRLSLDEISEATDVAPQYITEIAREFGASQAPLAIGGGTACAHSNATDTLWAINGLNAIAGSVSRPGGMQFYRHTEFPALACVSWLSERRMMELAQTYEDDRKPVKILIYETNPFFAVPVSVPIRNLFERADFIASFSTCVDETSALADLVLPDHSPLESWGDHVQPAGSPSSIVGLSQPVVSPLYDTRAIGDTVLAVSRQLYPDRTLSTDFHTSMRETWQRFLTPRVPGPPSEGFESSWTRHLQQGGWWSDSIPLTAPVSRPPAMYRLPLFDGDAHDFPLHLYPYPSPALGHGEGANLPWLQEMPDTLTTGVWGTWAEINPITARAYGISHGDMIRITSRHGSLNTPALHFPGIRPDVVAMPIGQGHTHYGRYASHRGVNPLSILAPVFDSETGALATGATKIRIEALGTKGSVVLIERPGTERGNELLSIESTRRTGP